MTAHPEQPNWGTAASHSAAPSQAPPPPSWSASWMLPPTFHPKKSTAGLTHGPCCKPHASGCAFNFPTHPWMNSGPHHGPESSPAGDNPRSISVTLPCAKDLEASNLFSPPGEKPKAGREGDPETWRAQLSAASPSPPPSSCSPHLGWVQTSRPPSGSPARITQGTLSCSWPFLPKGRALARGAKLRGVGERASGSFTARKPHQRCARP